MLKKFLHIDKYQLVILLFIVSIWAFNEEKYITYPLKIIYLIVFFFYCAKKNRFTSMFQLWTILMMGFSLLACLVAGFNESSLVTFLNVIQVFLIGYVTFGYLDNKNKMIFYLISFAIGGLALTLRLIATTPISVFLSFERLGESIGYNANDVGNKAMFAALACVFLVRTIKNKKVRLVLLLAFVLFLAIVLFSGSRKDLLGLLLGVFIVYTIGLKKKRYLFLSIVLLFGLSFILYRIMMTNESLYMTIGRRFESLIDSLSGGSEKGSIDLRQLYASKAWELIVNSHFLGVGLGQFAVVSGYGVYCHCDYLEVMCSFGLIGFIIYYLPLLICILKIVAKKKKSVLDHSIFSLAIVLLFMSITMVMYISAYSIILLSLITFQAYSKKRLCLNKKEHLLPSTIKQELLENQY